MVTRRSILKVGLGLCGCAACGSATLHQIVDPARADAPTHVRGRGYDLHFIGAQRETIMNGKLAAALDLRTLANSPHLYGIGPIEQLRGEVTIADGRPSLARVGTDGAVRVTQSFEAGAPFFVWAEVPVWQTVPIPAEVRSFADLQAFVPRAAAAAGFDPLEPFPFLIRGRQSLTEFHVLNRVGDAAHNMDMHKKIQIVFELTNAETVMVGFHSTAHRGIFTPMDSTIHIHFQAADNAKSGHVQNLDLGKDQLLSLPSMPAGDRP
jgi:acetolactate decarboxylase